MFKPLFLPFADKYLEQMWNELQRRIKTGMDAAEVVRVTAADTAAGYLASKLVAGTGLSSAVLNPGANEQMRLSLDAGAFVLYVDTIASLKLIDIAPLPEKTVVWLAEMQDFYFLVKGVSPYAEDLVTVIKPAAGAADWLAYSLGRWDDLQGDISQGAGSAALVLDTWRPSGAAPPAGYPDYRQYYFSNNQNDELSFRYQMPHKWLVGSTVYPHLHVTPAADPLVDQVINITGLLAWTKTGAATADIIAWTQFGVQHTVHPGDVTKPAIITLGAVVPPAGYHESAILKICFRRTGTDPADTYDTNKTWGTPTANLGLDSADCHVRFRLEGTVDQYPAP